MTNITNYLLELFLVILFPCIINYLEKSKKKILNLEKYHLDPQNHIIILNPTLLNLIKQ